MRILKILTQIFLYPGTKALSILNVSIEQDGGVFRSMFNMLFWGIVIVLVLLPFMIHTIISPQ